MACTVCVILTYGAVSYISQQSYVQLRSITISGMQLVKRDAIGSLVSKIVHKNRWGTISGYTLVSFPGDEVRKAIYLTYPEVKTVTIDRSFFTNTASVTITEYDIYARWCTPQSADCYYMTRDGYLFSPAQAIPGLITWYSEPPQSALRANVGGEYIRNAVALVESMRAYMPLTFVNILSARELELHTDTYYVLVRIDTSPEDTSRRLVTALNSKPIQAALPTLEYIDARFGTRMFYKERPEVKELDIDAL